LQARSSSCPNRPEGTQPQVTASVVAAGSRRTPEQEICSAVERTCCAPRGDPPCRWRHVHVERAAARSGGNTGAALDAAAALGRGARSGWWRHRLGSPQPCLGRARRQSFAFVADMSGCFGAWTVGWSSRALRGRGPSPLAMRRPGTPVGSSVLVNVRHGDERHGRRRRRSSPPHHGHDGHGRWRHRSGRSSHEHDRHGWWRHRSSWSRHGRG